MESRRLIQPLFVLAFCALVALFIALILGGSDGPMRSSGTGADAAASSGRATLGTQTEGPDAIGIGQKGRLAANRRKPARVRTNRQTSRSERRLRRAQQRRERQLNTPEARARRIRSKTQYRGLTPAKALAAANESVPEVVEQPAWTPPTLLAGERIADYKSPQTASIDMPGSKTDVIVESTAEPLAVEVPGLGLKPVSVALEQTGSGWRPVRSAVESALPLSLEEAIEVEPIGSDAQTSIRLADSSAPGTLTDGNRVFYANTATDVDAVVAAIPRGASVNWVLRSPESPEYLRFDLSAPGLTGQRIAENGDLQLLSVDSVLATATAPNAWDADGREVAARFVVRDDRVTVAVDHRGKDVAYPVAVDPFVTVPTAGFLDYSPCGVIEYCNTPQYGGTSPLTSGWGFDSTNFGRIFGAAEALDRTDDPYASRFNIDADPNGTVAANGHWYKHAFRSTHFLRVEFAAVSHNPAKLSTLTAGLVGFGSTGWGESATGWCNAYPGCDMPGPLVNTQGIIGTTTVGACARSDCGNAGTPANSVALNLASGAGSYPAPGAHAEFRGAYLYFSDYEQPAISTSGAPSESGWQEFSNGNMTMSASDGGVGLGYTPYLHASSAFYALLELDENSGNFQVVDEAGHQCLGNSWSPCPTTGTWAWDQGVREGKYRYKMRSTDIVGNTAEWGPKTMRVDNSGPSLSIGGRFGAFSQNRWGTDQAAKDAETAAVARTLIKDAPLTITGIDGTTNYNFNRRSGMKRIGAWITTADANQRDTGAIAPGGDLLATYALPECATTQDSCTVTSTRVFPTESLEPGIYYLHVQGEDQLGHLANHSYKISVGVGEITTVSEGLATAQYVPLQAKSTRGSHATARFQFRRGLSDNEWKDVPLNALKNELTGEPLSGALDLPLTGDLTSRVVVDTNYLPALDGELIFRAVFDGSGSLETRSSEDVMVNIDHGGRSTADDQAKVGPGSVDLHTGNLTVSATDAKVDAYRTALAVDRTYSSRYAGTPDSNSPNQTLGPLGVGWQLGLPTSEAAGFSRIVDSSDPARPEDEQFPSVTLESPGDGGMTFEIRRGDSGSADKYVPEPGFENYRLERTADPYDLTKTTSFSLRDVNTNVVLVFAERDAAEGGAFLVTKIDNPLSTKDVSIEYQDFEPGTGVRMWPIRMLAPVSDTGSFNCGEPSANPSHLGNEQRGCQALGFTYEAQGTNGQRLTKVTLRNFDPEADGGTGAMAEAEMVNYTYDSNARLATVRDPRLPNLVTNYSYDAFNLLTTVAPSGQEPFTVAYADPLGDYSPGRVVSASRSALLSGTATTHVRYRVPLSGSAAPHDMTIDEVSRWSQAVPPLLGTAVFPPDQPPNGANPTNYGVASVSYLDALGREVNSYAPGDRIGTTEYDKRGNVVRSLTPANRELALTKVEEPEDLTSQEASTLYDTQTEYTESPELDAITTWRMSEQKGPQHLARVSGSASKVPTRSVTRVEYDEGAPTGGSGPTAPKGPYDLPTKTTTGAETVPGGPLTDVRVKRTEYDWTLRLPVAQITDMGTSDPNDNIVRRFVLDPETGQEVERRQPKTKDASSSPTTTKTIYYKAGANADDGDCGQKPEWIGLVCKVKAGAQPNNAALPGLPEKWVKRYNRYRQPLESAESVTSGAATSSRTATTTYDAVGRPLVESLDGTTSDPDTAIHSVPSVRHVYDATSGLETKTESLNSDGSVAKTITRTFDTLGRVTNYVDGNGNGSSTSYDLLSRAAQTNDGKATQTRGYDPVTGDLASLNDSQIGITNAMYDADGKVVTETLPNGLVKTYSYDTTGDVTGLTYFKSTGCSADCMWYSNTVERTTHGQVVDDQDTFAAKEYEYDQAGRLTRARSTRNSRCTTRSYEYDLNSNRTAQRAATSPDANCDLTGGTTTNRSYDDGDPNTAADSTDRLTDAGYRYDSFGRITNVPQADAGSGGDLSATYYANDLARSIKQGTTTQTLSLDPAMRAFQKSKDEDGVVTAEKYAFDGDTDSPSWIGSDTGFSQSLLPVGVGGAAANATQVVAGDNHTCALISGAVKCWGLNTYGQLGNGTTISSDTPVSVIGLTSGVVEVSAGGGHTCARLNTGTIKCWGRNLTGQLGDNSTTSRTRPVSVSNVASGATDLGAGGTHTCAVISGAAKCWGSNLYGQLGNNSSATSKVPAQVSGLTSGVQIVDGGDTGTCAVTEAGAAKCWGRGSVGQMGDGTTTYYRRVPVNVVGMSTGTADIQIGVTSACATTTAGTIKCWGNNASGQLGDGTTTSRTSPVAVSGVDEGATGVTTASTHTCAVISGTAKCWGANTNGRLGDGTTTNHKTPLPVSGLASDISQVAVGTGHSCAVTQGGTLRCWGNNASGQIGPRPSSTYTRYVTAIGGGLAASYKSTGQIRFQIANVRGDVVAEADQNGLQQAAAVDEFGVPEDGALPEGRRYGFMGSHQREALTPGGTVAMGVRLYVPQLGRFLQVDPVLGGSDTPYDYAMQDPINKNDLDGRKVRAKIWLTRRKALRDIKRARKELAKAAAEVTAGAFLISVGTGWLGGAVGTLAGAGAMAAIDKMRSHLDRISDYLNDHPKSYGVYIVETENSTNTAIGAPSGVYIHSWNPKSCGIIMIRTCVPFRARSHVKRYD